LFAKAEGIVDISLEGSKFPLEYQKSVFQNLGLQFSGYLFWIDFCCQLKLQPVALVVDADLKAPHKAQTQTANL